MVKKKRTAFGVLDVFIILLVVVCAAGVAARYILTDEKGILARTPERTSAAVQVLITSIEGTSSDYFSEGGTLTVGEGNETGEIRTVTVTPAEYYKENEYGGLEIAYHDGENGKIDIRCTLIVGGYYRDGIFLLGGEETVIPGGSVKLTGGGITVTALIIDTAPFGG